MYIIEKESGSHTQICYNMLIRKKSFGGNTRQRNDDDLFLQILSNNLSFTFCDLTYRNVNSIILQRTAGPEEPILSCAFSFVILSENDFGLREM